MSTLDAASGVMHYDVHDPADLAYLIETGLIWRGGPKTQRLAADALLRGDVPRPNNLPEHIRAYLERREHDASDEPPGGANESDAAQAADPGTSGRTSDRERVAPDPSAWACPEHGADDVVMVTSRQGRVYGLCGVDECDEFDDGLTLEQRETRQAESERERTERRLREERERAERQAQLLADQRARTCAHCGRIERLHSGETHVLAGGVLAHATSALIQAAVVVAAIAALWLFRVSATTPDAPFHSLTGPLLCFWDWKGTACP